MTPEHHSQRYMVWNNTGVVKQYNMEEDCSIGVDFHDSSLHHSIHLANSQHGYSLAALSQQALVLGSEATTDTASRVWVQLLSGGSTPGAEQDWQVELPEGEDVTALAASNQVVVVASDRRLVRVLSVSGAGGDVLCVPGQLVCLAAHGHLVMMLYHGGVGAAGDQQIQLLVLNTDTRSSRSTPHPIPAPCPVPLSPRSFVAWAGFSDEGSPVVVDSEGYVRMMHPRYAPGGWTVLLATKRLTKGRSDHHFVLGVSETEGKVRSILCRGARYPPVVPPPYVTLLDFKVPVFDESSEKGELEAAVLACDLQLATLNRADLQLATPGMDLTGPLQEADLLLQTTLIKLFALACRSDRPLRAQHVCRLMNVRTLQSAVKYAAKLGRGELAETIADYAEERRVKEEELLEEEQRLTEPSSNGYTLASSSSQHLSLLATPTPAVTSTALDTDHGHSDSGSEGDDADEDTVGPTAAAGSNPLLAAAARRSKHQQHNLSLDASLLPSKVNPFKKAPQASTVGGKGFQGLDGYRPKIESSVPILRPVLKKKSKAERGLKKSQAPKESSQPSIKSNFAQSFLTGKENKLTTSKTDNATDLLDASNRGDADEASSTNGIPGKFADSTLFRSTAALHLWWADNEDTVRGEDHNKDLKLLVPRAALLFKDLPDSVKAKYKRLASQNATAVASEAVSSKESDNTDNKRKREDEQDSTPLSSTASLDNSTLKKQKPSSGISKLAAFAFNKE